MRRKIHPLAIHLGMAAANTEAINSFSKKTENMISADDAVKMMRGIQLYQQSQYQAKVIETKTVWKDKTSSLITIKDNQTNSANRPLILIPSLINKSHIFNLSAQCSVLRDLNENNVNAYLFDWGKLSRDETLQSLIENRLNPALKFASEISHHEEIDVLGYCMGGTLILDNFRHITSKIRKCVALAAPWDFKVENSGLARNVRIWSPMVLNEIEKRNKLPAEWIQALFASIDTDGSAKKFIRFADMDMSSDEAHKFIVVEDWLNEGVDLPRSIAKFSIENWFIKNELTIGQKNIACDMLIVASNNDKLVPYKCAISAKKNIIAKSVNTIEAGTGHIGLIVGRNAQKQVWRPILDWICTD